MSDDQIDDTIVSTGGGGKMKWLLGAAAAVILLGGGYFAWQNYAGDPDSAQTAYNDAYSTAPEATSEPLRDRTVEPGVETADEVTAADEAATPSPATASRAAAQPRRARPAPVSEIPEETIGVASMAEVATEEDIVVVAPRRPVWVQAPSARRLSALYPERALARGREGEARLHCTVLTGGALDCTRVEETSGGGFGLAALRVARAHRHAPQRADGADAAGTPLNLRVVFRIADEQQRRGRG